MKRFKIFSIVFAIAILIASTAVITSAVSDKAYGKNGCGEL